MCLIVGNKVRAFSETLNNKVVSLYPSINILNVICGGLEMASSIVALWDEDIVIDTTL